MRDGTIKFKYYIYKIVELKYIYINIETLNIKYLQKYMRRITQVK